jgi:hypothetical protein
VVREGGCGREGGVLVLVGRCVVGRICVGGWVCGCVGGYAWVWVDGYPNPSVCEREGFHTRTPEPQKDVVQN